MSLVPSFVDLLQPLSCVMTAPSFQSFLTLITGWVFARRCTVTGMIVAAGAAEDHKHHSAYHRLFAAARWSLDELGLAVFALILPLVPGMVLLAMDGAHKRDSHDCCSCLRLSLLRYRRRAKHHAGLARWGNRERSQGVSSI